MAIDATIVSPGRLRILTALALEQPQEFVALRRRTELTDGNLATHARRLSEAGLIVMQKMVRAGRVVTHFALTAAGRSALEAHARELLMAVSGEREAETVSATDEGWVD